MNKTKPIIFSTQMVQAVLEGRKTQTRRIVKPQPTNPRWNNIGFLGWDDGHGYQIREPYKSGEILWVRETWTEIVDPLLSDYAFRYKANYPDDYKNYKWKPSIHMPREAARIFLRVTNVRVERLQEITEEDAIAEGISGLDEACYSNNGWTPTLYDPDSGGSPVFRDGFTALWDSINAKRGYGWETNPWVWVYEFERVDKPGEECRKTLQNGAIIP